MASYNFSVIEPYTYSNAKYLAGMLYEAQFEYVLTGALANGDTITTPVGGLPFNGIRIMEVEAVHPRLDTNASPTGTYNIGDALDANRFVASASMGAAATSPLIRNCINQAQTLDSSNEVTAGAGFFYGDGENPQLILTVNAAIATAASSGYIRLKVSYYCEGDA